MTNAAVPLSAVAFAVSWTGPPVRVGRFSPDETVAKMAERALADFHALEESRQGN